MEITRHPEGATLLLKLHGRLDGAWSEHTGAALAQAIEEGFHHLRLDLAGVGFVSSAGIRVLVIHYKQLLRIQGTLAVVNPSADARGVLEMAGLGAMIAATPNPADFTGSVDPQAAGAPRVIECEGLRCEIHPQEEGGRLCARILKKGERALFPSGTLGLGIGAFESAGEGRLGEFLALGGAAFTQPADGQQSTDYVIEQGELVPVITADSGLAAEGSFASLIRFEAAPGCAVALSELVALALEHGGEAGGQPVGFVLAAETASLVGAALSAQPDPARGITFEFPQVREQLLFTVEPAWPRSFCVAAGFAAPAAAQGLETPLAPLLRPVLVTEAGPLAHVHAAAFPYRPLAKGAIDLHATLRQLLEEERALGLLHLLHDWRPGGLGESRFLRGALWVAPLDS